MKDHPVVVLLKSPEVLFKKLCVLDYSHKKYCHKKNSHKEVLEAFKDI